MLPPVEAIDRKPGFDRLGAALEHPEWEPLAEIDAEEVGEIKALPILKRIEPGWTMRSSCPRSIRWKGHHYFSVRIAQTCSRVIHSVRFFNYTNRLVGNFRQVA